MGSEVDEDVPRCCARSNVTDWESCFATDVSIGSIRAGLIADWISLCFMQAVDGCNSYMLGRIPCSSSTPNSNVVCTLPCVLHSLEFLHCGYSISLNHWRITKFDSTARWMKKWTNKGSVFLPHSFPRRSLCSRNQVAFLKEYLTLTILRHIPAINSN